MLNVGQLNEGVVLDHIKAGKSMTIYHDLKLDKLDCCVAIIKNARSAKMGRKDIIKVECPIDTFHDLKLDKLDCCVAIIKNARSAKMGRKDIIKVECPIDTLNLDILGFIDHNITVNIIKDGKIVEKKELHLPKEIRNVIKCKNPRCITSVEQELKCNQM